MSQDGLHIKGALNLSSRCGDTSRNLLIREQHRHVSRITKSECPHPVVRGKALFIVGLMSQRSHHSRRDAGEAQLSTLRTPRGREVAGSVGNKDW